MLLHSRSPWVRRTFDYRRQLSEQFWSGCTATGDCTNGALLRSVYRTFDSFGIGGSTVRRASVERTYFEDDADDAEHVHCDGRCWVQNAFADFDNVGHFRTETSTSRFPGVREASVFTDYPVKSSSQIISVPTGSWRFGQFSSKVRTVGTEKSRSTYCFNDRDQLLLSRALAGARTVGASVEGSWDLESSRDLVSSFAYSGANLSDEKSYGGDGQPLALTSNPCALSLPTQPVYWTTYGSYVSGLPSTRRSRRPDGIDLPFLTLDLTTDAATGIVKGSRSTDLLSTGYDYEAWGAIRTVTPPGETPWNYSYLPATSTTNAKVLETRDPNPNTSDDDVIVTYEFDRLGRLVRTARNLPGAGCVEQVVTFDALGRKRTESVSKSCGATGAVTTFTYDAFNRPVAVVAPDGKTTTMTYRGVRETTSTRDIGGTAINTVMQYDFLGRLLDVRENVLERSRPHETGSLTSYTYDIGDRLKTVIQIGDAGVLQERVFTYDNRGLLISEKHPEIGLGNGVSSYTYDARGHVLTKQTGSLSLAFEYDAAERVINMSSNSYPLKAFLYDSDPRPTPDKAPCPGNTCLGKLAAARRTHRDALTSDPITNDKNVDETHEYSATTGRLEKRTTIIDFVTPVLKFVSSQSYDLLGGVQAVEYPHPAGGSAFTQTFAYKAGVLTDVGTATLTYLASGLTDTVNHGTFSEKTIGDADGMARPAELQAVLPSGEIPWRSGAYSYDGSANITAIGKTAYRYDAFSRLTGWMTVPTSGGWSGVDRAYDAFGNFLYQTIAGCGTVAGQCYQSAATSQQINGTSNRYLGVSYNEAGDVIWEPTGGTSGRLYTYDAGTVLSLHDTTMDLHFLYTADDERVAAIQRVTATTNRITYTLRGFDNRLLSVWRKEASGSTPLWVEDELWRGGSLLGRRTPSGTFHFALDHLGSPRAIFTSTGTLAGTQNFEPFGAGGSSDGGALQFTGHERDAAMLAGGADLLPDYLHARYYSPTMGRFLSVDPNLDLKRAIKQPQSWNRYAYVENNPINARDLDGRAIDFVLDIAFIVSDLADISSSFIAGERTTGTQWAALGGDVVGAAVPFLTGVGKAIKLAAHADDAAKTAVYVSRNADKAVQYVGITNNLTRRAAEHAATKGIQITSLKGFEQLGRADARAVEQTLIEVHQLSKDGGTLMNKINSIAKTNPKYADALERGYKLLNDAGYVIK